MKWCARCVLPDTRPGIMLDSHGVCNACRYAEVKRTAIDWEQRAVHFKRLVDDTRRTGARYDCVIPVSGGKDSHWQVVTCLQYGLHPLLVTWKPPIRTELGETNLANLIRLGADHIDFTVNPDVHQRFTLASWRKDGTAGVPMHLAIHNITHTIAAALAIPLVIWGENSAEEYGATNERFAGREISDDWLKAFNTRGTSAADWVGNEFTAEELTPYFGPIREEEQGKGIQSLFLGYYFPWDPQTSREVAVSHGFQESTEGAITGYYTYADLDDPLIAVHHWLKWYKYGFTRSFDNLSLEIRSGRMTRDEAVTVIRNRGDETPHAAIALFCGYVGITEEEFYETVERFRNPEVWEQRNDTWLIPSFLIGDWPWHEDTREQAAA